MTTASCRDGCNCYDDDDDVGGGGDVDDTNGGDGVQQSQVSSSEPGPSILASNVVGPLLLEVCTLPAACLRCSCTFVLLTQHCCRLLSPPLVLT